MSRSVVAFPGSGRPDRPLLAAIAVLWLFMAVMVSINVMRSGGFAYTLDDAYIHLAIARNWADFGVWGMTRYAWGSSSSSLLWTSVLAFFIKLGIPFEALIPFVLNMVIGTVLVVVADYWSRTAIPFVEGVVTLPIRGRLFTLSAATLTAWLRFLWLCVFIFAVAIPNMIQNGMEHLLHALLALGVMFQAARLLARRAQSSRGRYGWGLLAGTMLLALTRYEGLFLVAAIVLLCLWQRRWGFAFALLAVSLIPLALYGWVSVQHGWYLLPNSVLVKSGFALRSVGDVLRLLGGKFLWERLYFSPTNVTLPLFLASLLALAGKLWLRRLPDRSHTDDTVNLALTLFLLTVVQHSMVITNVYGTVGRYATYLLAMVLCPLGYVAMKVVVSRYRPQMAVRREMVPTLATAIVLVVVLLLPFGFRGGREIYNQFYGSSNIYEQQVQMGRFLAAYYQGQAVAANDIGAINYYADIRCIDLIGLGTLEVARDSRDGSFTSEDIDALMTAYNAPIAVIYDKWFPAGSSVAPPAHWIPVAYWRIRNNVVTSDDTVTFYATSPENAIALRRNMEAFLPRLPSRVAYVFAEASSPE